MKEAMESIKAEMDIENIRSMSTDTQTFRTCLLSAVVKNHKEVRLLKEQVEHLTCIANPETVHEHEKMIAQVTTNHSALNAKVDSIIKAQDEVKEILDKRDAKLDKRDEKVDKIFNELFDGKNTNSQRITVLETKQSEAEKANNTGLTKVALLIGGIGLFLSVLTIVVMVWAK